MNIFKEYIEIPGCFVGILWTCISSNRKQTLWIYLEPIFFVQICKKKYHSSEITLNI